MLHLHRPHFLCFIEANRKVDVTEAYTTSSDEMFEDTWWLLFMVTYVFLRTSEEDTEASNNQ